MRILFVIHNFPPAHAAGSETYAFHLAREIQALGPDYSVRVFTTDNRPSDAPYSVRRYVIGGISVTEVNQRQDHHRFAGSFEDRRIEDLFEAELRLFQPESVHIHHLIHLSAGIVNRIPPEVPRVMHLHDYWLSCGRGGQRLDEAGKICTTVDLAKCARCLAGNYADISVPGRFAERVEWFVPDPVRAAAPGGGGVRRLVRSLLPVAPRTIGLPPKYLPAEVQKDLVRRREVLKALPSRIDRFIAPSRFLKDELVNCGLSAEAIVISDYGFAPAGSADMARHQRGGVFTVGFAGTLSPHKGAHVLLEGFRLLQKKVHRPVVLRICGNRNHFPSYVRQLDRLSSGLPVEWAGPFDDSSRDEAYGAMDVLVVPSLWWENSPLTIHEAFQRGLPVAVSDLGGMRELVAEGEGGVRFRAGDPASLAAALAPMVEDEPLRRKIAAAAPPVKTISEDARWTLSLYEELSARRRTH